MVNHIQQQWLALKQQDTLRREMIANISHDLRTPLASVQGYLETLSVKFDSLSDEEKQSYISTAVKQSAGLRKLIDSLFELAKLDAEEHKLKLENFPLLELVYDVKAKFDIKAQQKNIQLQIQTQAENTSVCADLGLIERVLDNLIDNAIYYSHKNSEINITIAESGQGQLSVKVSDSGCGIPENQQALVFERFHQAHTPERKDGHSGLGLCIVKKIIELHQQQLWVESKLDKGSQFNFTLKSA
jgi:signal transduction histidine kinase